MCQFPHTNLFQGSVSELHKFFITDVAQSQSSALSNQWQHQLVSHVQFFNMLDVLITLKDVSHLWDLMFNWSE